MPASSQVKSKYAALLNRLDEMKQAPYYATARTTLGDAESTIVALEAELLALKNERGFLVFTTHDRDEVDATFVPVDATVITQIRLCGTEEEMLDVWSKWEVDEEKAGRKPATERERNCESRTQPLTSSSLSVKPTTRTTYSFICLRDW